MEMIQAERRLGIFWHQILKDPDQDQGQLDIPSSDAIKM